MLLIDRWRVGPKLLLLAGVPVLGILVLSTLVVIDVRERAEAAAGLGSIEALAQLTDKTLLLIDELRWERAEVSYAAGIGAPGRAEVAARQKRTDDAVAGLTAFTAQLEKERLPPKLRQDLDSVYKLLGSLPAIRREPALPSFDALAYLEFFARANDSLIGATAAITQLSDDKQILISIGGVVSAMQVIERKAREHALLNFVFGKGEFPPGTFRYFVTLLTEEEVYLNSLRTWSSEEEFEPVAKTLEGPFATQIAQMRRVALDTTEGEFTVKPEAWFTTQCANMEALARIERNMAGMVRSVVLAKIGEAQNGVTLATGLVLGVVLISVIIGWAIARGLTRSVRVLSMAAEAVHKGHDFTIRAEKISNDELGLLTDAFNGMLAGIQARDRELDVHRQNLEALVEARTRQLSDKNEEMALVLHNVDQGLAMIGRDARIVGEPSRAFKDAFGAPPPGEPFYRVICDGDDDKSFALEAGYEQMLEEVLPRELALDQLPKTIERQGHTYALAFTPVLHGGQLAGALLVARDITNDLAQRRAEAAQREHVRIIERLMRDRAGFQEFFEESKAIVASLRDAERLDDATGRRLLHTLKGLTAVFDITSVSEVAHELEQALADGDPIRVTQEKERLLSAWEALGAFVRPLLGEGAARPLEVVPLELAELIDAARRHEPHSFLVPGLIRLTYEPVARRFERMLDQIKRVVRRLHKQDPLVVMDDGKVRLPPARFRVFWATMPHVIRNMVDHGFEDEVVRLAAGKPAQNRVELRARLTDGRLLIEVSDDGRGIDWERLARKARERGLPSETRADIVNAMFADGVSTASSVTDVSGRGIGMSAVRQACLDLGGTIGVHSERGCGTRFSFVFPAFDEADFDTSSLLSNQRESDVPSLRRSALGERSMRPSSSAN